MNIIGLPALIDTYENYIWILYEDGLAWVVDPGESKQVIAFLKENNLQLKSILITHYHFDHVDGISGLKLAFPNVHIYGAIKTKNPFIQTRLSEGNNIPLTNSFSLLVLDTPGHTFDHISYYNNQLIFCGDTLFTAGCGRKLGGSFTEFSYSILKLRGLADNLDFYCAHEYTQDNLKFARLVDPDNQRLQLRASIKAFDYPNNHIGTLSSLAEEKATNPFLRFDEPVIKQQLLARGAIDSPEGLFKELRDWKDQFDKQN